MLCLLQQKIIFYKMCSWGDSRCQRVGLKGSGAQGNSPFPFFFQDSRGLKPVQEDTPQLMRTRSDVGVRRRGNVRTSSDQRRIRRHRFSINGHFYNHKVKGPVEEKNLRDITTSWGLLLQCHVVPGDASGKPGIFQFSLRVVSVMEASLASGEIWNFE